MSVNDWLEPWYSIDEFGAERGVEMAAALEAQLRREISPLHVLAAETVRAIARRQDMDTVLFALDGGRVAEVHLTWNRGTETDPRWPGCAIFGSLEDWQRTSMAPLHDWWKEAATRQKSGDDVSRK
jgi:hypothetical protein